jgi:hypothetical protein
MPGGVVIQRTITLPELPRELQRFDIHPASIDYRPALQDVSVYLGAEYKRSFAESRSPDGTPFAPLKRPRRRRRDRRARGGTGQKPLIDRGLLQASGSGKAAQGSVRELHQASLEQGTSLFYADWQNRGTRTIKARPFVGIAERQATMIERIVADRLMRQYFGAA